MWTRNLFDSLKSWGSNTPVRKRRREEPQRRPASCRLAVEALEDRCVPASLSIGDITAIEGVSGSKDATVIVRLSEPSTKTVSVNYTTSNGSARAGSDYDRVSGKLTFAPGETARSILVPVRGDRVIEPQEQFFVNLSRARNADIADGQGVVTVVDSSPVIRISHEQSRESAIDQFMTFTVSLSVAYDETVTVNHATQDGTYESEYADGAYAGQDYVAASGMLTFAPGETSKEINVLLLGDSVPEYDEYFYVVLSGVSANAQIYRYGSYGQGFIFGELGTPM